MIEALFLVAMGAGAGWLLSENRRADALAQRDQIGEAVAEELARKYACRIALGEALEDLAKRRRFAMQFAPEGYTMETSIEANIAGARFVVAICEVEEA